MANKDNRRGLVPVDHQILKGYCGKSRPYYIPSSYATALFTGDPVIVTGTSNGSIVFRTYRSGSLPEINKATAGDGNPIAGVITGFDLPSDGGTPFSASYKPASVEAVAWVCDDPYVIFEIQSDSANPTAKTDISSNANVVYTHGGDIVSGRSGVELDTSSMTTTNTYQLKILGLVDKPNNELGTHSKLLVTINNHFYMKEEAGI
jgi:hypothetical protein